MRKMINNCNIARDLIPQYAENLLSDGSREFVDTHCSECPDCKKILDTAMVDIQTKNEKRQEEIWSEIAKKQKRKKIMIKSIIISASVLIVITAIFFCSFILKGNTWFVNIDISESNGYKTGAELSTDMAHPGKDEVDKAAQAVIKYFQNNFGGSILLSLKYDEELTSSNMPSIVFEGDYFMLQEPVAGDMSRMKNNWHWYVDYNKTTEEWQIIGNGYD